MPFYSGVTGQIKHLSSGDVCNDFLVTLPENVLLHVKKMLMLVSTLFVSIRIYI